MGRIGVLKICLKNVTSFKLGMLLKIMPYIMPYQTGAKKMIFRLKIQKYCKSTPATINFNDAFVECLLSYFLGKRFKFEGQLRGFCGILSNIY